MQRLDYTSTGLCARENTGQSANPRSDETGLSLLSENSDLMNDFLYSVHTTKLAVSQDCQSSSRNTIVQQQRGKERQFTGVVGNPKYDGTPKEASVDSYNLPLTENKTAKEINSSKENINNKQAGSNFVEINIVSVESPSDDRSNLMNSNDKSNDNEDKSDKMLGSIVKNLIRNVFHSPHKSFRYNRSRKNNVDKNKEVKISVDELFNDKHKLDFIVDNKKEGSLARFFSSKKFMFLQLCFLTIMSIYFMSFYNSSHRIRALK